MAEKVEKQSDKMGWPTDSVRRMYVDPQSPGAVKVHSKRKKSKFPMSRVPDDDSAHDSNWNVQREVLTDEQLVINQEGIAQVRAAAQHEAAPYDPKAMVETARASWEHVVADSVQAQTDTEVSERGVYIGLDERRVALEAIADIFAQRNRTEGFHHALEDPIHVEELSERYRDPKLVAENMARLALKNQPELKAAIATLLKQDEILAQGYPLDSVAFEVEETERGIISALGSNIHHYDRNKALKDVRQAAKKRS